MSRIVIACYKPKPGQEGSLRSLVQRHVPLLRSENLVTDRVATIMQAKDGTIIEVFEWLSNEAIEAAHSNPRVREMWDEYATLCDFTPVGSVEEATQIFSEFTPLDF